MTQEQNELKLAGLPDGICQPLQFLVEQLKTTLIDNLAGVTVVGSALTTDYRPGASDINTVVLLKRHRMGALASVAALAKPGRKKRLSPPLMMTASYIERSRDVFGVESDALRQAHPEKQHVDDFHAGVLQVVQIEPLAFFGFLTPVFPEGAAPQFLDLTAHRGEVVV